MIVHEGREFTASALYCVVNKFHCGKANIIVHEGEEVLG